jgi:DeoR/GlpR family transcriptional regulator of sugar metabolism
MHKLARQKHILDRLSETGQLSISELVEGLQVSADTIRRDLSELEKQGVLQKSHGGAIALNVPAMTRQGRNALLPRPSSAWVSRSPRASLGSTLFLDAGSTVLAVAAS